MAGRDIDYERPILLSCGGCDVRWTALTAAHCASCHETFAGTTTGFDAHRVDGACLPPERVGLRDDRGYWLSGEERPPGRLLREREGKSPAGPRGPNPRRPDPPRGERRSGSGVPGGSPVASGYG